MTPERQTGWGSFYRWLVLGVAAAVVGVLFGLFVFLAAVALGVFFAHRRGSLPGFLCGVGALLMLVVALAWFDRGHWCAAKATHCTIPTGGTFAVGFAIGAVVLIVGVVLQARRSRSLPGDD